MVSLVDEMNGQPSYAGAWSEYRKLRNQFLLWTALLLVVPVSVAYASARFLGSTTPGLVLGFIAQVGWFISGWRFLNWTCPQCGERFGVPLRRRCRRCGLAKWK